MFFVWFCLLGFFGGRSLHLAYFWLCAQGSLLAGLGELYAVQVIKLRLTIHRASILSAVLSLQSFHCFSYTQEISLLYLWLLNFRMLSGKLQDKENLKKSVISSVSSLFYNHNCFLLQRRLPVTLTLNKFQNALIMMDFS